jgi:hypothetical protein
VASIAVPAFNAGQRSAPHFVGDAHDPLQPAPRLVVAEPIRSDRLTIKAEVRLVRYCRPFANGMTVIRWTRAELEGNRFSLRSRGAVERWLVARTGRRGADSAAWLAGVPAAVRSGPDLDEVVAEGEGKLLVKGCIVGAEVIEKRPDARTLMFMVVRAVVIVAHGASGSK